MYNWLKFFKRKQPNKEQYINSIKQEVEGGFNNMRNEEQPAPTPTIHEREINLTLINDKLNYVIQLFNKVAEKEGISLED